MTPSEALDVTRIYSVAGTAQRARRCAADPLDLLTEMPGELRHGPDIRFLRFRRQAAQLHVFERPLA